MPSITAQQAQHTRCISLPPGTVLAMQGAAPGACAEPGGAASVLTPSEDDVLAVQPGRRDRAQEELASVGVLASVGHGKHARPGVLELEVLVIKLIAIDGLAAGAVAVGEVAALRPDRRCRSVDWCGVVWCGGKGAARWARSGAGSAARNLREAATVLARAARVAPGANLLGVSPGS